ncbi:MAG: sugar-binding transcriptional regulator [Acetobacteraceae bacterium]
MDDLADSRQLRARIAWLYHKENMTQGEIGRVLGLTRLRVNRMLAECRARGLVQVTLDTGFESCIELERRVVKEFGLADAVVIPTPRDPDKIQELVGQAAGQFLSRTLRHHKISSIGVGWGLTLGEAIRSMERMDLPGTSVISMMGGLTRGAEFNTFEIASGLARRLHASCSYLVAPIYAGSSRSRDILIAQDVFAEVMARMRSVDIAFLSLGDVTTRSLLIRYGLPDDLSREALLAAGAVGDVLGQFIDRDGTLISHEVNRRVVSLPLTDLRRIPTVILAAGGTHKAAVIKAALRGRLAHVLISDEATVQRAVTPGA